MFFIRLYYNIIIIDPTLSQLDERLVRILAFQRLQQLVEKKVKIVSFYISTLLVIICNCE